MPLYNQTFNPALRLQAGQAARARTAVPALPGAGTAGQLTTVLGNGQGAGQVAQRAALDKWLQSELGKSQSAFESDLGSWQQRALPGMDAAGQALRGGLGLALGVVNPLLGAAYTGLNALTDWGNAGARDELYRGGLGKLTTARQARDANVQALYNKYLKQYGLGSGLGD